MSAFQISWDPPCGAEKFTSFTGCSEPAIKDIELRPTAEGSDVQSNVNNALLLFSQNSCHSMVCNDASSSFLAMAILRMKPGGPPCEVHPVSAKDRVSMPKR